MGRLWSDHDRARLEELCERYRGSDRPNERIGRELGRTARAVENMMQQMGLSCCADGTYTLSPLQIGRMLGHERATIIKWLKLAGLVVPHEGGSKYAVEVDRLWEWMETPESFAYYTVEAIQDPVWREHFAEVRRDWLSLKEAARELTFSPKAVAELVRSGKLAAARTQTGVVWVRKGELALYRECHAGEKAPVADRVAVLEAQVLALLGRIKTLEAERAPRREEALAG